MSIRMNVHDDDVVGNDQVSTAHQASSLKRLAWSIDNPNFVQGSVKPLLKSTLATDKQVTSGTRTAAAKSSGNVPPTAGPNMQYRGGKWYPKPKTCAIQRGKARDVMRRTREIQKGVEERRERIAAVKQDIEEKKA